MIEDVKLLLKVADEDLEHANEDYKKKKYRYACYFAQQAVEKYLKAYLLYKEGNYPFKHSISYLIKECAEIDEDFEYLFEIGSHKLNKYYTGTRYLPLLDISEEEAKEAIEIAEKVRNFVLKKLES